MWTICEWFSLINAKFKYKKIVITVIVLIKVESLGINWIMANVGQSNGVKKQTKINSIACLFEHMQN